MAMVVFYGATSGALHAVSGPDHVLSLAPVALATPERSLGLGLRWGVGHALGTLLLALPFVAARSHLPLEGLAAHGDRVAGIALVATALFALRSKKKTEEFAPAHRPVAVGFVHGVTGASSLLLLLPSIARGDWSKTALFLAAFAVGSSLAMGALTDLIGRASRMLDMGHVGRLQQVATVGAVLLGLSWVVAPG